jgi:hypothetical protein
MHQSIHNQYPSFNPLAAMSFLSFHPIMANNNMSYPSNNGGWPFGEN